MEQDLEQRLTFARELIMEAGAVALGYFDGSRR
jgi:hypothetical protein